MLLMLPAAEQHRIVALQLKMQRARARMQRDELMVKHFVEIVRDLQSVARGGGDQEQVHAAVGLLQKMGDMEELTRREREAGTTSAEFMKKICPVASMQASKAVVQKYLHGLRPRFESLLLELKDACPTTIKLFGDGAGVAQLIRHFARHHCWRAPHAP